MTSGHRARSQPRAVESINNFIIPVLDGKDGPSPMRRTLSVWFSAGSQKSFTLMYLCATSVFLIQKDGFFSGALRFAPRQSPWHRPRSCRGRETYFWSLAAGRGCIGFHRKKSRTRQARIVVVRAQRGSTPVLVIGRFLFALQQFLENVVDDELRTLFRNYVNCFASENGRSR